VSANTHYVCSYSLTTNCINVEYTRVLWKSHIPVALQTRYTWTRLGKRDNICNQHYSVLTVQERLQRLHPQSRTQTMSGFIFPKRYDFGRVYKTINLEIDKIDATVSTFVYLLLVALHVPTPFLGHPQAYINTEICYRIVSINMNSYEDDPGKRSKYVAPAITNKEMLTWHSSVHFVYFWIYSCVDCPKIIPFR
jgi:hypothetical protein